MVASKTSLALLSLLYLSSHLWVQRFLTHVQSVTSHLDRKIFQTGRNSFNILSVYSKQGSQQPGGLSHFRRMGM